MSLYDRIVNRSIAESHVGSAHVGYVDLFFSPVPYYGNTDWSVDITPDNIAQLVAWRKQCPDYRRAGHASFCKRCDELLFPVETGWDKWLTKDRPIPDGGGPGAWPEP